MQPDIQQLTRRIEELEKWKEQKMRQQLSFPLDQQSKDVIQRDFIQVKGIGISNGATGAEFPFYFTRVNGQDGWMNVQTAFFPITVDTSTDVFTTTASIANDTTVYIQCVSTDIGTQGVPPNPLSIGIPYYIVNTSGNTFKLSLTVGGAAINITDSGTGTSYLSFI